MKTKLIAIVLGTCVCTLLTNCTIEKRLFQPGYSIEWKKKTPKKDDKETLSRISESEQETDPTANMTIEGNPDQQTETPFPERIPEPEFRESVVESITPAKGPGTINSVEPESRKKTSPTLQQIGKQPWETEEQKEFELFGVMSFGLYFSSLTLAILGIILLTSPYFFVAAGFMILLALIFGIISVDKYRRDKSRYRRNFFGYFGMIASLATITFVAGLVILAWGLGSF